MSNSSGRFWITFNGEIYNYRELRRRLQADGCKFTSDSDTEVLLELYARHGSTMLKDLNGIFAFAVWDTERGELFVARDRLGVKPLYYASLQGRFVFASEIKAILPALPASPRLRSEVLPEYLSLLWVPDPDTLFEGINKLPPGHLAYYADGRLSVEEWWDFTFAPEYRSERSWACDLRDTIGTAVRRQLVADVPVGSFLSGGLDSSAIVAAATAATGPITTYTVGYSPRDLAYDVVPDDVQWARKVGRHFATDYHERVLDPSVVDLLPRLVWHLDEPVADPAALTTYLICAAAGERLKVILSGMGGDELFAGYPRVVAARIGQVADIMPRRMLGFVLRTLESRVRLGRPGRLRGPRRNLLKLLRGLDLEPQARYLAYSSYYRPAELSRLLSPGLRAKLNGHDPLATHWRYLEKVRDEDWLNQILYLDLKTFLPCLNLAYTDKMSMAASTEVRVPLLDDEVVGIASRIPAHLKLKGLRRKYILKRSMEGVLPRDVIWRRKAGFGAPIRAWIVNELAPVVDEALSPRRVAERGLFDPAEVSRIVERNRAGTQDHALQIWALLTLELWLQSFVDGSAEGGSVLLGSAARG
jgi:asparagine synthase (glutamine-hydrolysing)